MRSVNANTFLLYLSLLFLSVSVQCAACSVRMGLKEVAEAMGGK